MPIDLLRSDGLKPGLVIYLTAGDPSLAVTRDVALAILDAGAEVIELGVPFSDPVADGPVIQRASERALANKVTLADVLSLAAELRKLRPSAGLVLFSYFNPILHFGLSPSSERFCERAAECGVDGVLITDVIVEEAGEYLRQAHKYKLKPIFLAAPTSTDERLKRISTASEGFVYAISHTGTTGVQSTLDTEARRLVERIRPWTKLPIAVGFGISRPEHVAAVGEFADAAVLGSAIVSLIENSGPAKAAGSVADFINRLRPVRIPSTTR